MYLCTLLWCLLLSPLFSSFFSISLSFLTSYLLQSSLHFSQSFFRDINHQSIEYASLFGFISSCMVSSPLQSYSLSLLVGAIGSYFSVIIVWLVFSVAETGQRWRNVNNIEGEIGSPRFMGQRRTYKKAS